MFFDLNGRRCGYLESFCFCFVAFDHFCFCFDCHCRQNLVFIVFGGQRSFSSVRQGCWLETPSHRGFLYNKLESLRLRSLEDTPALSLKVSIVRFCFSCPYRDIPVFTFSRSFLGTSTSEPQILNSFSLEIKATEMVGRVYWKPKGRAIPSILRSGTRSRWLAGYATTSTICLDTIVYMCFLFFMVKFWL